MYAILIYMPYYYIILLLQYSKVSLKRGYDQISVSCVYIYTCQPCMAQFLSGFQAYNYNGITFSAFLHREEVHVYMYIYRALQSQPTLVCVYHCFFSSAEQQMRNYILLPIAAIILLAIVSCLYILDSTCACTTTSVL